MEDFGQAVYGRVLRAELQRRLPAASMRVFAPYGPDRPTRSDRGAPAEALGPWSPARVAELAAELDMVLVGGDGLVEPDELRAARYGVHVGEVARRAPGRFFVGGLGAAGEPRPAVHWYVTDAAAERSLLQAGIDGPIVVGPHPAVLLPRLLPPAVLEKRLEYLQVMGWYPREAGALVVQAGAGLVPLIPELVVSLRQLLDDHPSLTPVLVELGPSSDSPFAEGLAGALGRDGVAFHRLPSTLTEEDVAAVVSSAGGFIGSSTAGCLTALGYGTPWAMLTSGPEPELTGGGTFASRCSPPQAISATFAHALKSGPDEAHLRRAQAETDAHLDQVAQRAVEASRGRHPGGVPDAGRPALENELRALRLAHRTRTERSIAERVLLADHVARAETELAALRSEAEELRQRADAEAAVRARYEAECAALRQTRTFRWTASARSLYRRLGGGRAR